MWTEFLIWGYGKHNISDLISLNVTVCFNLRLFGMSSLFGSKAFEEAALDTPAYDDEISLLLFLRCYIGLIFILSCFCYSKNYLAYSLFFVDFGKSSGRSFQVFECLPPFLCKKSLPYLASEILTFSWRSFRIRPTF